MKVSDTLYEKVYKSNRLLKSFFNIPKEVNSKSFLTIVEPSIYTIVSYPRLQRNNFLNDVKNLNGIFVLSSLEKDRSATQLGLINEFLAITPSILPYLKINFVKSDSKYNVVGMNIQFRTNTPFDVKKYVMSLCCSVELCSGYITKEHIQTLIFLLNKG